MDLPSLGLVEWLLGAALFILILYKLGTWNYTHFSSRGIKTVKPVPFIGSMASLLFKTRTLATIMEDICKEFKEDDIVGMFQLHSPTLVVKSPELIKLITVKDFEHFTDHQRAASEAGDPLFANNLFSLTGERWREMRATLSPAFTSGKIKNMFVFMDECGQQMSDYIQNEISEQEPGKPYVLEMKDLFTRYTNDVIATTAFGVRVDSLKEKDNEFYLMGRQITDFSGIKPLKMIGYVLSSKLMEFLGITICSEKEKNFFLDLVHTTITTREREGIVRPDIFHLLMEARKGTLKSEGDDEEVEVKAKKRNLTENDIASQAVIFFLAGFDTASTLLSFCSILLAQHEDIQKKLQEEMEEVLGDSPSLTYEKVQKMKYLDMVISETLRLYPSAVFMNRECTKTYTIPATENRPEYTVRKGDVVLIPVYGIHRDPNYYPDPEKFDPERFSDENKHKIAPYTYLPFGVGPRLCIGQRFALLEAKVALIHILHRFSLIVVEKTPLSLKLDSTTLALKVKGGFWMGAVPRQ